MLPGTNPFSRLRNPNTLSLELTVTTKMFLSDTRDSGASLLMSGVFRVQRLPVRKMRTGSFLDEVEMDGDHTDR